MNMSNNYSLRLWYTLLAVSVLAFHASGQKKIEQQIDELYDIGTAIGLRNLDSVNLVAKEIIRTSALSSYEYGIIRGKVLASYYFFTVFKPDTARVILNECLKYFEETPKKQNTIDYASTLYYLSVICMRASEYAQTEIYGNQAIRIFEKLDKPVSVAAALSNLGTNRLNQNKDSDALEFYLQALRTKQNTDIPPDKLTPELLNIGRVYTKMGQYESAIHYINQAIRIFRTSNMPHRLMDPYTALAENHLHLRNYDSALHYYEKSSEIANQRNNVALKLNNALGMARVHSARGDLKQSNNILLSIVRGTDPSHTPWTREFFDMLASNYLQMGKNDSAIYHARLAYTSSIKSQNWRMISSSSLSLFRAFEQKKRFDSAIHYLKIHYAFRDSTYNIEHQKRLSTLYAEIETLAKENTIKELEQAQVLKEIQNSKLRWTLVLGLALGISIVISLTLVHRNQKRRQLYLNMQLQAELDQKKKDLYHQALHMIHLNNGYKEIEENLKKLKEESPGTAKDVRQVLRTIHMNSALEKEWDNFNEYFGSVHGEFYEKIHQMIPNITLMEKRLAGLIRMNLSNGEIARIMNIEVVSVKQAKYRLKRKLGLPDDQNIYDFIVGIH
jgi:tetratricopeptide (TPR) repeat protein